MAAPLAAGQAKVTQAVKSGVAPTAQELMQRVAPPKAFGGVKEVENRVPDSLKDRAPVETLMDPLAGRKAGPVTGNAATAGVSFGGYDSDDNSSQFGFRIMPPDTEGDVGLTHYVQYNNLGWKYWDKATQTENGPFPGNIFWQGFGGVCDSDNAGDPIVLYDQFADRWVFSQFTDPGNPDGHQCFAVTQGNNPARARTATASGKPRRRSRCRRCLDRSRRAPHWPAESHSPTRTSTGPRSRDRRSRRRTAAGRSRSRS